MFYGLLYRVVILSSEIKYNALKLSLPMPPQKPLTIVSQKLSMVEKNQVSSASLMICMRKVIFPSALISVGSTNCHCSRSKLWTRFLIPLSGVAY